MSAHIAERIVRVDASLAKQLRDSMEHNARLKNQLRALVDMPSLPAEVVTAIRRILNDGEACP